MYRPDTAYIEAQTARCFEKLPKEKFVEPFWTEAKDAKLRILAATHTCISTAREMTISRKAINRRAKTLGVTFQKKSEYNEPSFEEWRATALAVAAETGICAMAIIRGDRHKSVCMARWMAWRRILDANPNYSLAGIGRVIGWDHTSIRFGLLRLQGMTPADIKASGQLSARDRRAAE